MIILRYHEIFFRLTAPRCPSIAAGAVSLRKSNDIEILSFDNIVKGQANKVPVFIQIKFFKKVSQEYLYKFFDK